MELSQEFNCFDIVENEEFKESNRNLPPSARIGRSTYIHSPKKQDEPARLRLLSTADLPVA